MNAPQDAPRWQVGDTVTVSGFGLSAHIYPEPGVVREIIEDGDAWPYRVDFPDGRRAYLDADELEPVTR